MPTRRRPLRLLCAVLALAALALGGCSDDGDEGGAGTTTAAGEGGEAGRGEGDEVVIDMKDYAFDVSGAARAGTTTITMKNTGKELHMAAFGLLQPGKTLADLQAAVTSEDEAAFGQVLAEGDSPGTFLSPGAEERYTFADLKAGTYGLMCFIPTAGEGVPHVVKGMLNTLVVEEGEAAGDVESDIDYAVSDGRTEGPTTLKAGTTTLKMTSSGAGPHELIVAKKKDPSVTYEQIDAAFDTLFESETPPPVGYADSLPAVIEGSTFDIEPRSSVALTLDLEPGTYLIGCAREPDEEQEGPDARAHTGELLEVTVT
ncbi:MAG: hypothetical protein ACRDPR_01495 [Nocardioidaceae bacterium]